MHAIIFTGYERSGGLERVSGAYRIATTLRREGWDVEVIDFFYHWDIDQLKDLIKIEVKNTISIGLVSVLHGLIIHPKQCKET
jgi:Cft2 family RNA processing exonuclease